MKSYYVRHRPGNHGGKILAVVMILCIAAAYLTMMRNEHPEVIDKALFKVCSFLGIDYSQMPEDDNANSTVTVTSWLPDEYAVGYDFSLCYFYNHFDDFDKAIYEIFYDMIMHKDVEGYSRSLAFPASEYSERAEKMYLIYDAMLYDNPEFFYLEVTEEPRVNISGMTVGNNASVSFTLNPGIENENNMIGEFEYAADLFMEDINLLTTDAEIELQIHDKLIDLVSYDYAALERDPSGDLAHTAYGALVDDGHGASNSAVCSGYARAFQYLLKKAGIMSVQVSGVGGTITDGTNDEGSHGWNLVLLDGEWYETDCTWDDPNFESIGLDEDTIEYIEGLDDAYFASTHYWYNRTTEEMKHLPEMPDYVLEYPIENGVATIQMCDESYHIRGIDPSEEGYELVTFINEMLPVAEGTKYGLGL